MDYPYVFYTGEGHSDSNFLYGTSMCSVVSWPHACRVGRTQCTNTVCCDHQNSVKRTTKTLNLGNQGHLMTVKTMENTW